MIAMAVQDWEMERRLIEREERCEAAAGLVATRVSGTAGNPR
jgi:hypothetical protein